MMFAISDWVERLDLSQEVRWYQLGALVNELVEGVLPVCTGLTPDDRAGLICYATAVFGNGFAIGLHITLSDGHSVVISKG